MGKFILIAIVQVVFGQVHGIQNRSVELGTYGEQEANLRQFPYMVYITMPLERVGFNYSCTAYLMKTSRVLLSAHCIERANSKPRIITVIAGIVDLAKRFSSEDNAGLQERYGKRIVMHQHYNKLWPGYHDVAILIVNKPFDITPYVKPGRMSPDKIVTPTWCIALGWGATVHHNHSRVLMFARVRVAPASNACEITKSGEFYCTLKGGSGLCHPDSGGPLICAGLLKGLATYVRYDPSRPDGTACRNKIEQVYVDLSEEVQFIEKYSSISSASRIMLDILELQHCLKISGAIAYTFFLIYLP